MGFQRLYNAYSRKGHVISDNVLEPGEPVSQITKNSILLKLEDKDFETEELAWEKYRKDCPMTITSHIINC